MELLFVLAVIAAVASWIYQAGKRTGSKRAYGIGRRHERNAWWRRGRRR